jgi:hypothetical protein
VVFIVRYEWCLDYYYIVSDWTLGLAARDAAVFAAAWRNGRDWSDVLGGRMGRLATVPRLCSRKSGSGGLTLVNNLPFDAVRDRCWDHPNSMEAIANNLLESTPSPSYVEARP